MLILGVLQIKNNFVINGDVAYIELNSKSGNTYTIIDIDDLEKIKQIDGKWYASYYSDLKGYYVKVQIDNGIKNGKKKYTSIFLHRYITNAPKGYLVDHKNHNTLDNRKFNLREVKYSKNGQNRISKNINNKSGYRNVFWNTGLQKWEVSLCRNYKRVYAGYFDDVDEAGRAAEEARRQYYGDYAGEN